MTEKLKQIIETARELRVGEFRKFFFVPNGTYGGFWGPNGFCNIGLYGWEINSKEWVEITDSADVFSVYQIGSCNIEIPEDLQIPVLWFHQPIHIDNSDDLSTILGEGVKEIKE